MALAAFAPGQSFALRLVPKGSRILAQFGAASLGVPGVGLHTRSVWTDPVNTGLPPRTSREKAVAWAQTAFPGADVQWAGRRRRSRLPAHSGDGAPSGDGMCYTGEGQAGFDPPSLKTPDYVSPAR